MARRLMEICEPVIHGEPVTDRETHSLKEAYRAYFGDEDPDAHWAHVLVDEIRSAASERLDWLDAQAQAAKSVPSAPEPGDGTWMGLLRKAAALKVDPSTPKKFDVPVVPVLVSRRGPRWVVALFGKVLGKVRYLGATVLVEADASASAAYEHRPRAQQAILRTIRRLSATPESLGLPSYALDVELVALLIERYGFEGSGGNGKIKPRTMTAMLIDPGELADDLRRYADRQVESADEAHAGKLRTRFNDLIARLHERACADSNPPPVASNGAGNSRMRVPGGRGGAERKERAQVSGAMRSELEGGASPPSRRRM